MAKTKKKLKVQTADRRIKEHETGGSRWFKAPAGTNFFNPKETKAIRIAVIPYEVTEKGNPHADPGVGYYERTAWVHYGIGPNQSAFVCNAKTFSKKCPVCEYRANLMKKGGDEDQIKALAPKERQLFNVVDRKNEDKGVQIWEASFHNFGKFLDNTIKEADPEDRESAIMFADPEEGSDIRATPIAQPTGGGRTYNQFSGIQLIPRTKPLPDEWLEAALNLDKMVQEVDYDELKKIFLQTEDEAIDDDEDQDDDSDDDDEDDKPAAKNGKPKPSAKDDDEEEEEEEEDDEDPSAEDMGLEVGMMVTHKKWGTCKITKISGDGTSVRIKDKLGKGEERNGIAPKDLKVFKSKDEDEDDDDEDDEPAPKKASGKKPAAKDEDDDDDDDEDDDTPLADKDDEEEDDNDDDDDEPAKKPVGKKPAAKKPADDDDDDDDEPAPVKRGRGRPPGSKNKK